MAWILCGNNFNKVFNFSSYETFPFKAIIFVAVHCGGLSGNAAEWKPFLRLWLWRILYVLPVPLAVVILVSPLPFHSRFQNASIGLGVCLFFSSFFFLHNFLIIYLFFFFLLWLYLFFAREWVAGMEIIVSNLFVMQIGYNWRSGPIPIPIPNREIPSPVDCTQYREFQMINDPRFCNCDCRHVRESKK